MSNLIQMQAGHKAYGSKVLFDEATLAINTGEHVGVIGPNGAGKTTLFKILIDQESLDSGILVKSQGLKIGYLAQHDEWTDHDTVEDYLIQGTTLPIWELKSLGEDLGISQECYAKPIKSLSGGYRMRCKLLHMLGQQPDIMLLDEPTNYLDLETLLVLERFLQDSKHAFLLISHDREFLRKTTDHILEIEAGEITKFNGNIDDYFEQKALLKSQLETRALSLSQKRKEILDFVARFGAKATKARQAQSRLKQLAKMESIELKEEPVAARIHIPPPTHTGKNVLSLEGVDLGYEQRTVLKDIHLRVQRGDHLAVVGVNGVGKSTLLKGLAHVIDPLKGTVELGYQASIGYYAQHVSENLNPAHTVYEALQSKAHSDIKPQEILNLAGTLLFSGDSTQKKISVLSGGEKSRVALGQILLQKSPCLILDEPTNHLDFQTVEALTLSLMDYSGTVIVVSHDRSFIRRIATKILEIKDGRVHTYPGDYDSYVWGVRERVLHFSEPATTTEKKKPDAPNSRDKRKEAERELRATKKKLEETEKNLTKAVKRLEAVNEELAQGSDSPQTSLIEEMAELHKSIRELETLWMETSEKLESLSVR